MRQTFSSATQAETYSFCMMSKRSQKQTKSKKQGYVRQAVKKLALNPIAITLPM